MLTVISFGSSKQGLVILVFKGITMVQRAPTKRKNRVILRPELLRSLEETGTEAGATVVKCVPGAW
jgi:hypothetical protein